MLSAAFATSCSPAVAATVCQPSTSLAPALPPPTPPSPHPLPPATPSAPTPADRLGTPTSSTQLVTPHPQQSRSLRWKVAPSTSSRSCTARRACGQSRTSIIPSLGSLSLCTVSTASSRLRPTTATTHSNIRLYQSILLTPEDVIRSRVRLLHPAHLPPARHPTAPRPPPSARPTRPRSLQPRVHLRACTGPVGTRFRSSPGRVASRLRLSSPRRSG